MKTTNIHIKVTGQIVGKAVGLAGGKLLSHSEESGCYSSGSRGGMVSLRVLTGYPGTDEWRAEVGQQFLLLTPAGGRLAALLVSWATGNRDPGRNSSSSSNLCRPSLCGHGRGWVRLHLVSPVDIPKPFSAQRGWGPEREPGGQGAHRPQSLNSSSFQHIIPKAGHLSGL